MLLLSNLNGQSRWYLFSGWNTSFFQEKDVEDSRLLLTSSGQVIEPVKIQYHSIPKLGLQFGVRWEKRIGKNIFFTIEGEAAYNGCKIFVRRNTFGNLEITKPEEILVSTQNSKIDFHAIRLSLPLLFRFRLHQGHPIWLEMGGYISKIVKDFSFESGYWQSFYNYHLLQKNIRRQQMIIFTMLKIIFIPKILAAEWNLEWVMK